MIGQDAPKRAPRGRPKKKPDYCREDQIESLIESVVKLYGAPYDDRDERGGDEPTLKSVADELGITPGKVRKLLITADYFSTAKSRRIQALHDRGMSIRSIMEKTGLNQASVYNYLPYSRGAYKLPEPTIYAEQTRLFRKRKKACETLEEHMDDCDVCEYLWHTIEAFENYVFVEDCGDRFKYSIKDETICCNGTEITREEINNAFRKARELLEKEGSVCSAEALCCCGAEQLLTVFLRIGACENS